MLDSSVVSSQSVYSALNHDQSELRIGVLSVLLQMLSHVNSLLDQMVKILGELGGGSVFLQDSQDLASGNRLDLRDSVLISEEGSNLGWSETSLGELDDLGG